MTSRHQPKAEGSSHLTQSERFIEAARAAGCNEDEAAFKAKLAVIARQKPKSPPLEDDKS